MAAYKAQIQKIVDSITPKTFEFDGEALEAVNQITAIVQDVPRDPTTEKGRKEIKSLARALASARIAVDTIGKDHKAELTRIGKVIDAQRNIFKSPMESLQVQVLEPVTLLERKEKERVSEHQELIEQIKALRDIPYNVNVAGINERLTRLSSIMQRDFEEFFDVASAENDITQSSLYDARNFAIQCEEEAKAIREREIAEAVEASKAKALIDQKNAIARLEREKKEAHERAERDKQAAIIAERESAARQARLIAQENECRAQDQEHRKQINRVALAALQEQGFSAEDGKKIIIAIANGKIPHITVNY